MIARDDLIRSKDAFINFNGEHGRGYVSGAVHQLLPTDVRIKATLEAWSKPEDAALAQTSASSKPLKI